MYEDKPATVAELQSLKVQRAVKTKQKVQRVYLLVAQHPDGLGETARKDVIIGGWSMVAFDHEDLKLQCVGCSNRPRGGHGKNRARRRLPSPSKTTKT